MPVVNPGIRRFLGSAIQRLFNSASFYAPLTHSLVPERGTGSPTFTRATTKTWQNNDGYLVTGVAGEIGFVGARRVRNLNPNSQAIGAWTLVAATVSSDALVAPDGTTTADSIFESIANSAHAAYNSITIGNGTYIYSVYLKKNGRDYAAVGVASALAYFNLSTGVVGTVSGIGAVSSAILDNGNGWYRCSLKVTGIAGNQTVAVYAAFADNTASYAGDITKGIHAWGAQLEDVTSQTTQTAGEYVSVGVPSDWAGDELVTNGTFEVDSDWAKELGWTIGGGVASASAASATLYQTDTLSVGTKYVASFKVASISAGSVSIRIGAAPLVPYDFKTAIDTYSVEFVADAASMLIGVIGVGFTGTIDNISVKPAYYHGSFVDGVKCFATDINGAAIT